MKSGTASSDNLRLKGQDVSAAMIGSVRWNASQLDLLTRIRTVTSVGDILGKIPAVQKFVKKHEDLLKITGIGKELKRFGIEVPDSTAAKPETPEPVKTPVTVVLRFTALHHRLKCRRCLKPRLDKPTLSRLKSLMN